MSASKLPEYWLRGPLPGINSYLQPVAHALLQAREEVNELMKEFPSELLQSISAFLITVLEFQ